MQEPSKCVDSMARRLFDAFNRHDAQQGYADLFAADAIQGDRGIEKVFESRDAIAAFIPAPAPARRSPCTATLSEDGYRAEWEYTGVNSTDSVGGITSTNKPFRVNGVSVGVLNKDGKIVSHRDYDNLVAILKQIGLFPASGVPSNG